MLLKLLLLVASLASTNAQTPTPDVTYGCVEESSSRFPVEGNYSWYQDWESHSIWIQQTEGETYIVYFDTSLGNMYQAFGLYKCDSIEQYTEQVEEMNEKSPKVLMYCQGSPVVFCPALDEDDAIALGVDGMNANDGSFDWIPDAYYHFYECPYWFDYEEDMSYPSISSLTFQQKQYCPADSGNSNPGSKAGAGQKVNTGTDAETKRKIDGTTLAILWTLLGLFIAACLVFIGVFVHKWKHRHVEQVHVNLRNKEVDLEEDPTMQKGQFDTLDINDNQVPIATAEDGHETRQEVAV